MNIKLFIASLLKKGLIRVLVAVVCCVFSVVVSLAIAFTVFDFANAWKSMTESDEDNGAEYLLGGLMGGLVDAGVALVLWTKFLEEFNVWKFTVIIAWSLVRFPVFLLAIYARNYGLWFFIGVMMTATTGAMVYTVWGILILLDAFVKKLSKSCREAALEAKGHEQLPK